MDTERFIPLSVDADIPNYVDLEQYDLDIIEYHVELTREVQEIQHLYGMLRF